MARINYMNTFFFIVVGTTCRLKLNPYSFGYLVGALHILNTTIGIWKKTVDWNICFKDIIKLL
jgi:hypothetical protein